MTKRKIPPLVPKGGRYLLRLKTIFLLEFCIKIAPLITDKQCLTTSMIEVVKHCLSVKKMFYHFKIATIWKLSFCIIAHYHKIWRTTFPKEFLTQIGRLSKETNIWNKIVKMLLWDDFILCKLAGFIFFFFSSKEAELTTRQRQVMIISAIP